MPQDKKDHRSRIHVQAAKPELTRKYDLGPKT
jgi:hypothetical protein